jgi:hypothetical protein
MTNSKKKVMGQCSFVIALNRHHAVFLHPNAVIPGVPLCNLCSSVVQRAKVSDCHNQYRKAAEGE